ncbi:MAG: HEAT repeat domain-containing protein, partial [Trichodesmium sp. MAG_R02]|nr:HEAT repeat domain-containing protein [Trichodesmium sp. MAG_R02]
EEVRSKVKQIFCSLYETDFEAQVLEMLKQREDLIDKERLLKYRAELGENDEVIGELLALLQDENFSVRLSAAVTLITLKNSSEKLINSLLALLQDENFSVRLSAALALGNLKNSSEKVINSLLAML